MKKLLVAFTASLLLSSFVYAQINWTEITVAGSFTGAWSVYADDVDSDGDMDILGAAWDISTISWWENDGNQNFTEHIIANNFAGASRVYTDDLDSDGDVDVLGAGDGINGINWWENDGSENFTEHIIASNYAGAWWVHTADVDGDDDVDVLGAAYTADDLTWWENDGSENFTEHTIADNYDGSTSVHAIDFDGDGDVDVLGAAYDADDVTWWENDGYQNFTEHTIAGDFDGPYSVQAADVDSDGDMDALGAALDASDITWWENDGNQNFTEHLIDGSFDWAIFAYAADIDGDRDMDVIGAASWAIVTWWENDGNQNFTGHNISAGATDAGSVYAADVDSDGDMDVLGALYSDSDITWWCSDLDPGLSVTLTPHDPPITIPATGGSFQYDVAIENITAEPIVGDAWIEAVVPGGTPVPLIIRTSITFPANTTISRPDLTQNVPASAPPGIYSYVCYTGEIFTSVIDYDQFTFEKLATDGGSEQINDWNLSGWEEDEVALESQPTEFALMGVYPNPFNPSTTLSFSLPDAAKINLSIFDIYGRLVATLADGWRDAGLHEVAFDGSGLASGVYIYKLQAGDFRASGKMALMK
jgi:hypothetical protein